MYHDENLRGGGGRDDWTACVCTEIFVYRIFVSFRPPRHLVPPLSEEDVQERPLTETVGEWVPGESSNRQR